MYQALYRKWRPQSFSEVVGQSHITDTLRAQVASGRFSHAYLFSGSRGTGKTTCAKILAKAVNCEHPINGDPCNECASCRGITDGSILDVLEIDAASQTGVDGVRDLKEEAFYSPASVKYRVYIIDEIHMFSTSAFNALLKILEEPPAHVLFVLATTEPNKVPATVASRCQRFSFRRMSEDDLTGQLMRVSASEGIKTDRTAAEYIARLADGGMRDALSIFEQCATSSTDGVTPETVLDVCGLAGGETMRKIISAIGCGNAADALAAFSDAYSTGRDASSVINELSGAMRDLAVFASTGSPLGAAYPAFSVDDLKTLSANFSAQRLLDMLAILGESGARMAFNPRPRTEAEYCIMRLCCPTSTVSVGECGDNSALIARIDRLEAAVAKGIRPTESTPATASKSKTEKPQAKPVAETPTPNTETAAPADNGDNLSPGVWAQFVSAVRKAANPMLSSFLFSAAHSWNGSTLKIIATNPGAYATLHTQENSDLLHKVAQSVLGEGTNILITNTDDTVHTDPLADHLKSLSGKIEIITK